MGAVIGSRWRIRRHVRGTEQEDRGGLTSSDSLLRFLSGTSGAVMLPAVALLWERLRAAVLPLRDHADR